MEVIQHNILKEDQGERIDKVVSQLNKEWSRSQVQQWIKEGHIKVNEESVKPNFKCPMNAVITVIDPGTGRTGCRGRKTES